MAVRLGLRQGQRKRFDKIILNLIVLKKYFATLIVINYLNFVDISLIRFKLKLILSQGKKGGKDKGKGGKSIHSEWTGDDSAW